MDASLEEMPTTLVRRLVSAFSRSSGLMLLEFGEIAALTQLGSLDLDTAGAGAHA